MIKINDIKWKLITFIVRNEKEDERKLLMDCLINWLDFENNTNNLKLVSQRTKWFYKQWELLRLFKISPDIINIYWECYIKCDIRVKELINK